VSTPISACVEEFASTLVVGADVVDVGCGLRPYESFFAHTGYLGIDVDVSGREAEGKRPDKYFDGVHIPFEDETMDAVLCTEVLEHCVDPGLLAVEMYRVLKPGGKLLITVPFMWGEHEAPFDFRRYSRYGICQQLERAEFQIDDVRRLATGIDAISMLVHSEINNYVVNIHQPEPGLIGTLRRKVLERLERRVWRYQLALWSRLFRFERIYIDTAVLASKSPSMVERT